MSAVAELPLDLDAFEGPFDLLLTLVLKEELELADVAIVEIVLAFLESHHEDLEVNGEFLVLVAALLELKARALFPAEDEVPFDDLDPDDAAGELAERLAQYRRFRAAAGWLEERLEGEADRYFRLGPAPLAPIPERPLAPQEPQALAGALRALALEPPAPSLRHITLTFPPVALFLERFRAVLRKRGRFVFDKEVDALTRVEQAVAFLALLELRKADEIAIGQTAPFEEITVWRAA
ncbi:MAG: segregation/condensation protein A [Gaiellaceae bacterium]